MALIRTLNWSQIGGFIGFRIIGGSFAWNLTLVSYDLGVAGWEISFFDKADKTQRVGVISSDIQESAINSIEFNMVETGCGDAGIMMIVDPDSLPFRIEYNQGIEIRLYHDPNPWYSGYITELPATGMTKRPWKIGINGYFNQLQTCITDKDYSSTEISAIIVDLMESFIEEKTDILLASHKIVQTAYTVTDIRFDYTTAKKAIQQLSDLAQSWTFGVDAERELFFRGMDPEVNPAAVFIVGKNINDFQLEEDATELYNRIHVRVGLLSGTPKTNILAEASDYDSQIKYGIRERVMTAPSVRNVDDGQRWGAWKLDEHKWPRQKAKIPWVDVSGGKIEAKGKARIIDKDGNDHSLEIKKANYKIGPNGIRCKLELGKIEQTMGKVLKELLFQIANEELLQGQNMSQL